MIRLLIYVLILTCLGWGVVWLADHPGQVALNWGGWQIETSAGVLGVAVLTLTITTALVYRLWLFLTRAPGRIGQALKERRSRKGYLALTQGMVAVAAGDAHEAQKQVAKADGLLGAPPLTLLLKAQAAQLNGDETAAATFFEAMLAEPETEFLGLRGLLTQAIKRGDDGAALELARRAQALKPKSEWLAGVLFDLESRSGHWVEASGNLKSIEKAKHLDATQSGRMKALTFYGQSLEAEGADDLARARKMAAKAVGADPAFLPAALRYAKLLVDIRRLRKAASIIEEAWRYGPHPGFAELYREAKKVTVPLKRVAAMEGLARLAPNHGESHLIVAEAALAAELWGQARNQAEAALDKNYEIRRAAAILAELESRESGEAERVRFWLMRAASAPSDAAWVCQDCGHVEADWTPHCAKCSGLDTLKWETPPGLASQALVAGQAGADAEILPPSTVAGSDTIAKAVDATSG